MSTDTRTEDRQEVVRLWLFWKENRITFNFAEAVHKARASVNPAAPKAAETRDTVESALASLRNIPQAVAGAQRQVDLKPDGAQLLDRYYRDFARVALHAMVMQLLCTTENPPSLLGEIFSRDYAEPMNIPQCWNQVADEFVAIAEKELEIVNKL